MTSFGQGRSRETLPRSLLAEQLAKWVSPTRPGYSDLLFMPRWRDERFPHAAHWAQAAHSGVGMWVFHKPST